MLLTGTINLNLNGEDIWVCFVFFVLYKYFVFIRGDVILIIDYLNKLNLIIILCLLNYILNNIND